VARPAARVLVLAGTAEGAALARMLHRAGEARVVASLAGRTRAPAPLPCPVRTGGFGGPAGLAAELRRGGYDALVDATHPFASRMAASAAVAAAEVGIPRVRLLRPPWRPAPGDDWHPVPDLPAAADAVVALGARRVLLTIGRQRLAAFAGLPAQGVAVVVRSIDPPAAEDVRGLGAAVVLARPPFDPEDDLALLREHAIDTLVTRNSGGPGTEPKLTAARLCGARVVMVDRPPPPPGPVVATVTEARAWLLAGPA
jgi:precorrin-6A/cobalt-precorrin-6A reductase